MYWTFLGLIEIIGILSAAHAVMSVRTPQGTIAWAVSLIAAPVVALPAYWVFGRNKFKGYVQARQNQLDQLNDVVQQAMLFGGSGTITGSCLTPQRGDHHER